MHGVNPNAVVMRRPDGSPMTRQEVIVRRRGTMKWLPVLCSNDLVHGSWWFTWGSFFTALFAIYPLIQKFVDPYKQEDDVMPAADYDITWALLIVSGTFFTFGSIAFVHAFEEPPQKAFFHNFKHAQTDELLGAWMFLFGTIPAVPYMLVFFSVTPNAFYFFGLLAAIVFVLGSCLFVVACYPNDKKHENYVLPLCIGTFGAQLWVIKHLANDWLAGTWFFFWANLLLTVASFLLLLIACGVHSVPQIFIWLSGTVCSFLFLVGSAYFVAGSYPHASQFYYATDRGQLDAGEHKPSELYADEIGIVEHSAALHRGSTTQLLAEQLAQLQNLGSTVVSPFHSANAEAEKARRMVGKRRSVYGGSVTGAKPGETFNPIHNKLRHAGFTMVPTSTSVAAASSAVSTPVLPQTMEGREGADDEIVDGERNRADSEDEVEAAAATGVVPAPPVTTPGSVVSTASGAAAIAASAGSSYAAFVNENAGSGIAVAGGAAAEPISRNLSRSRSNDSKDFSAILTSSAVPSLGTSSSYRFTSLVETEDENRPDDDDELEDGTPKSLGGGGEPAVFSEEAPDTSETAEEA